MQLYNNSMIPIKQNKEKNQYFYKIFFVQTGHIFSLNFFVQD